MEQELEIFDSHLHILDKRFPLVENQGFTPDEFTCDDYLYRVSEFNIIGGAVVSGSFQAYDNEYLFSALKRLGANYIGIINLPNTATDDEIIFLNEAGIRGIRFNFYRGGAESVEYLLQMANRVFDLVGWHVELYLNSENLPELSKTILQLPSVSIDHLGLRNTGFKHLLKLVEKGVKVKATGFGRIDFDPKRAVKEIYQANSESLMFGTDLPSTRAEVPFKNSDISLLLDILEPDAMKKVFSANAINFYRIQMS